DLAGNLYVGYVDKKPTNAIPGFENDKQMTAMGRIHKYTPTGSLPSGNLFPKAPTGPSHTYDVSLVPFDFRNLPDVRFTRLNSRYRAAVNLAKLILRSSSFELHSGKVRATSFLVDMNSVFEDFVVTALRETLGLSQREFPQNAKGKWLRLDEAGQIGLEPDISWWQGNNCCFVGDVKYKRINVKGIKHPDIYQLLSYTIAAGVPEGLLIYAKGEAEPAVHMIRMASKKLKVIALDLTGKPDEVLAQIRNAADHIKQQKSMKSIQTIA
ncbi:McrC family protein, partial [Mariniblastus sp.]|nr:McrC family protein [Mariniblastus sp.]